MNAKKIVERVGLQLAGKQYLFGGMGLGLMPFVGISSVMPPGTNEVQQAINDHLPTVLNVCILLLFFLGAISWCITPDNTQSQSK
jgi:hypothetical protein